ncbi:uncharacterized protein [Montipora capricornis]|uniref:uncharacterized protein n=1 Tax=Montipora capricornis TaxID=246305 RepID=UPI0035F191AD
MTDAKQVRGHSRKLKIGVGGQQPVQSWNSDVELQPTISQGKVTAAQNTDLSLPESLRHPVAQKAGVASKQAFTATNARSKRDASAFPAFHNKNAPVKVSVTGEWALKECQDHTSWANQLLKRGKRRLISDIRRSVGDGQTLVYLLETLAGQKIAGVYTRPVTRAQKLENLQLCMSFMGNRNVNLQGIYVGGGLTVCLNPFFPQTDYQEAKGKRVHYSVFLDFGSGQLLPIRYDIETRPHGSSSGYHSDDASPTQKAKSPSLPEFHMPGMLGGRESPFPLGKVVHPKDVIITTRTELDKRGVLQTAENSSSLIRTPNGTISLEERLRSLLNSPNPGGHNEEETEEELLIPPPPRPPTFDDDDDVERRLQSLLDVAEEDKPDGKLNQKDFSGLKDLDRIGYVPSHPSQKMRNVQKGRSQGRTNSFTGNVKPSRGAKLPQAPQSRRSRLDSDSSARSPVPRRKLATAAPQDPLTAQPQTSVSQKSSKETRSGSFHSESSGTRKVVKGEGTPPQRFERASSHADFLKQVADKLADRSSTSTPASGSDSVTPAETPMLPTLSPASSVATFVFVSTSDSSSGLSSDDDDDYRSRRRRSGSGTPGSRRDRGKGKKSQDLQSIRKQLETLEGMYGEILSTMEVGSKDSKNSKERNSQRAADIRASLAAYKKQRNKDIKAVNKRFGRLESHVVTLARSVAHLSSELRSQASISQDMDDMRKQVHVQEYGADHVDHLDKENTVLQTRRVKKLRSFFGEDPPLLAIFLKKLGYERFADNFEAEQVGILELSYMTEERLQSLGIPLGPRLRIMEEVKKLASHLI